MHPFQEVCKGNTRLRTFTSNVHEDDLIWHRDNEDRNVKIVKSDGWYFQRDGELPFEIKAGDVLLIKRCEWHRIIKRDGSELVVEIQKI